MSFYKGPSNEMLLKKIQFGTSSKEANKSFIEQVIKKKAWVPGPIYKRDIDWNTNLPKFDGKFKQTKRYLISDDIINKHKKKETSVPGPNHYISTQWANSSKKAQPRGIYQTKGERTSFVMQPSAILENVPSPDRYEKVRLEGYLPRTPQV